MFISVKFLNRGNIMFQESAKTSPSFAAAIHAGDARRDMQLSLDEANHRIGNSLQLIRSLLGLQANQLTDETAKLAIRVASQRIHAVGRYHSFICHRATDGVVRFDELLREHVEATAFSLGLEIRFDAEPTPMDANRAMKLLLAVNELVINARKHAYGETEEGVVRIACRHDDHGDVRVSVSDEGAGFPKGFEINKGDGVGFRVISSTMRGLKGAIERIEGRGACVVLTVPLGVGVSR